MSEIKEITQIENVELSKIVNESGLQLNEAETIKQSYLPYFEQMAEIKELAKKINFENPSELDEKIARDLRLKTVKIRTGSEEVKNERKRIHSLKANIEQSAWNLIKSTCQLDEETFLQVEKKREIAEKLRIENLRSERFDLLSKYLENAEIYPLGTISDEAFNDLLNGSKLAKEAKDAEVKRIELERIEKENEEIRERARIKAENDKLKAEAEKAKKEAEEKAKKEKEIKDKKDLQNKKRNEDLRPYIVFIRDYSKLLNSSEAEFQKEFSEIKEAAIEHYKFEAEEKAKKDAAIEKELLISEAKIKAERDEKERLQAEIKAKADAEAKAKKDAELKAEAELKAKQQAEAKAAKAPIKQQLNTWVDSFSLGKPIKENATTIDIENKFESFKLWAKTQIENL